MVLLLRMRWAVVAVQWRMLRRDRGALIMSFALPALVFAIFAVIFSGTSGGEVTVTVAVHDARESTQSRRLLNAMQSYVEFGTTLPAASIARVESLVREGSADIGVVVYPGSAPLDQPGDPPAIELITDPTKMIASAIISGVVARAVARQLPQAGLVGAFAVAEQFFLQLTPAQRVQIDEGLATIRALESLPQANAAATLVRQRTVVRNRGSAPLSVSYYAAAVAIMFVLFSALNTSASLITERNNGLLARLAQGPGGVAAIVDGRFAFLTVQGMAQIAVIFVVAWFVFGAAWPSSPGAWLAVTFATAFSASGIALLFVSLFSSHQSAQNMGSFSILVLSAIGGSMVPRFMMPAAVSDMGWFTPNTWVLEAYAAVLWRGGAVHEMLVPLGALLVSGALGLWLARVRFARAL
jgi:ABC-2 type transport system permease protein